MFTYASNQVLIAAGNHAVSGYAEDSFISIDANGDGIMKKVGCDGEVSRAVSPDNTYTVKIALMQGSPSNKFFQGMYEKDRTSGDVRGSENPRPEAMAKIRRTANGKLPLALPSIRSNRRYL